MATFDEKEFLWDEVYNDVATVMSKKRALDKDSPKEWLEDYRKLHDFRDWIADTPHEEINFRDAMNFFNALENKYASMPDKW